MAMSSFKVLSLPEQIKGKFDRKPPPLASMQVIESPHVQSIRNPAKRFRACMILDRWSPGLSDHT